MKISPEGNLTAPPNEGATELPTFLPGKYALGQCPTFRLQTTTAAKSREPSLRIREHEMRRASTTAKSLKCSKLWL